MGTPDGPDAALAIRAAVEGDVTKIVEIERACFADPWSAISFVRVLREQHSRLAVAVRDGGIVGYSVATYVADEGELGNIAVIPHAQGHGIGRALLAAALREGWTRGAANVYLEVRASNAGALRLYERAGFAELGRRHSYYTDPVEDAILMVRPRPDQVEP
jgi:ribosomal-protein-alanine N-acetyltransferase